jgi:hypothetical protein
LRGYVYERDAFGGVASVVVVQHEGTWIPDFEWNYGFLNAVWLMARNDRIIRRTADERTGISKSPDLDYGPRG